MENTENVIMENETTEVLRDRDIGSYISRVLKIKLAGLLRAERLKTGKTYREIAKESSLRAKDVYRVEHGREKMDWALIGMLLRYFHKRVVLELVDMDETGRNLVYARMRDKPVGYALDVIELTE